MIQNWKKQASVAYGYSLTRLALNYYMYLSDADDQTYEQELSWAEEGIHRELGNLLQGEPSLEGIRDLRCRIQQEMEAITAFADCFRIYEYALNRMERRLETDVQPITVDEDEFIAQLMGFLTNVKDTAIMNQRIQMIIAQLPVRFTRQKFYSMVLEALSIYTGADQSSLDNMMYLLRTGAMVELTKEQRERYPQMSEILDQLGSLSFRELELDTYREALKKIAYVSERLYALSDACQDLQNLINDLYVLCLTGKDAMKDTSEEANARLVLEALYQHGSGDSVTDQLYLLEGVQEHYYEKYQRLQAVPEYQEGEAEWAYKGRCIDKLLSASPFASLEDAKEEHTLTQGDIETVANDFFQKLDEVFAKSQKPVVRAIMASTLSNLPVCFHSLEEIGSYMENSLGSCTDSMEKETCMELLQQLMETEEYALL